MLYSCMGSWHSIAIHWATGSLNASCITLFTMKTIIMQANCTLYQRIVASIATAGSHCAKHTQKVWLLLLFIISSSTSKADYTIASGTTVNPSSTSALLNATGTIHIYGTMSITSDVTFTSASALTIIIYGANGQIYWNNNKTLSFPAGTTISFVDNPQGLQPISGNAAQVLQIGTIKYAASNDNSNNVIYSFAEMNNIGGTARVSPSPSSGVYCAETAVTLSANQVVPTGDVIKVLWSVSPNTGSFSANNSSTAVSTNLSGLNAGDYTITCKLYSDAGSGNYFLAASKSITLKIASTGTWLGANTDWSSTANWCNGTLPTAATSVVIPNGLNYYPVINGTAAVNNITIASGGAATITVNGTLQIAGAISSTAAIKATAGNIELIGTSSQSISATNFYNSTIANLTIANSLPSASAANPSVSIAAGAGMLSISGAVSFGNVNNAVLKTNDLLTLLSSATATARVADITNNNVNTGNNITGKAVIERYIPAKRAWRLLTAPVTASSMVKISTAWQEGAASVTNPAVIDAASNPAPGYGTHITYGSPASNGYDQGVNGNTSIKYLTPTGWNGIPAATNNGATSNTGIITDQPGYFLFVRGDRSTPLSQATSAAPSATILRVSGQLNTGATAVALKAGQVSGSSSFRVVGNPFAAPVDLHQVLQNAANVSAGFADAFYIWDPNIGGANGVGGWVALSYNSLSGQYEKSVNSNIDSSGKMQSGMAVVVDYSGSANSIIIRESDKAAVNSNSMFRPAANSSSLRTALLAPATTGGAALLDAALVSFDASFSNAADKNDLRKLNNFTENISIQTQGSTYSIERRQPLALNDTLLYRLTSLRPKAYQLQLNGLKLSLPANGVVVLDDSYLATQTVVDLHTTFKYDFTVDANPASAAANRLKIIVKPFAKFEQASAIVKNTDVQVNWVVSAEISNKLFEIQRSTNGEDFYSVGTVQSKGISDKPVQYQFTDLAVKPGQYFYRIKASSVAGAVEYTPVMQVKIINSKKGMFVFPNPVSNNRVQLQLNSLIPGDYTARLYTPSGSLLYTQTIQYSGGFNTFLLDVPGLMANGQYLLKVSSAGQQAVTIKVMVVKE
ncbi:MAG: hypothetical protein RL172_1297 [Bacteroidota bacterium]